jgi:hypothetical protein
MARKAKEVLLARGYTEEELKGMDLLLKDQKFCAAIEAEANEADERKAKVEELQGLVDGDTEWYSNTCVPEMEKMANKVADAEANRAASEARLKAMQESGLRKVASQGNRGDDKATPPVVAPNTNPDNKPDPRYVPVDTFTKAYREVGHTFMSVQDMQADHQELFGKRLRMTELEKDYQTAIERERFQGSIVDFWEKKYKVGERRSELDTQKAREHDDSIRKDERTKLLSEMGNPMTRIPVLSNNPFTNRTVDSSGKPVESRPWERTDAERSGTRVNKFTGKILQSVQ